jgi:putative transposase
MIRRGWIKRKNPLSVVQQCHLAGVSRATVYVKHEANVTRKIDLLLSRMIDEEYTRHPFFGSRKMVQFLLNEGHVVNRKHVQRLMREMGLAGMAPGPNTSKPHPEHNVYPYLLRGIAIIRPNQVWSTDITYIRLKNGFSYLVAVIDWYSRKVLSWRLSNSMEAIFCVDCLEDALRMNGKPEIFNSDQGAQFTSIAFTSVLKREGITISMDGRGRAFDNIFVERLWRSVKHEDVYLNGYSTMPELTAGLAAYMAFYNGERSHQSLDYRTPNAVYNTGIGGGALIVDKFGCASGEPSVPLRSTEGSPDAKDKTKPKPGQRRSAAFEATITS